MKYKIAIASLFLLISSLSYSQNYRSVDSIVDAYPDDVKNCDKLIALINKDFIKQDEKARAIFRWVTSKIEYDVALAEKMNYTSVNAFSYKTQKEKDLKEKAFKSALITQTMSSRKAVCHGYSALVEYLCTQSGLEAKIVVGNLKADPSQIGEMPNVLNHAWNVIKIDGKWQFIDATLAAGFISNKTNAFKFYFNESYFFTNPERFFLNHYPQDEKWLFTSKSKVDFAKLPLYFGYYFQYKYQMVYPELGTYSIAKNPNFTFLIKGLDVFDDIQYSFNNSKMEYFSQEDNKKDFNVVFDNKEAGFLTIYVNRKIVAMYKIVTH